MVKAVLTTKAQSLYDDLPEQRYHFPATYLRAVEAALGDWIVYYEPRRRSTDLSSRGGRQAYFATARIVDIEADPSRADHFYALIADYLEFEEPVPFREAMGTYERGLMKDDGSTNRGAFGRAVRPLTDPEYDTILHAGFGSGLALPSAEESAAAGSLADPPAEFDRPLVERLTVRPVRDAAFARQVKTAYANTCAVTGLRLINGGGRAEVQAAHIRPVADRGPDSVRNGLALSGTVHWMFDRGLISIDDDFTVLTAEGKVPDAISRMLRPDGKIAVPEVGVLQPHRQYLAYHREQVFKG